MVGALEFRLVFAVTHITAAGPVAESVKNQREKTSNEFSDLANATRTPPPFTAANGQNLTRKKRNSSRWYPALTLMQTITLSSTLCSV